MASTSTARNDHLAEHCRDELCPRLPCRMWKDGYGKGWEDGYDEGYRKGYAAGYSAGYGAGYSAGFSAGVREAVGDVDERVRQAGLVYERAVFSGDAGPLAEADRELDAAEADLAVARGRLMHTRFLLGRDQDPVAAEEDPGELPLFERAARLYRALGDVRGEAEALFWVGCFHQVVRRDNATAVPVLEQSLERASQAGDKAVMSEALRHLGIAAHATGRLEVARQRLEESTRLRRETALLAGAAANIVGLAYIAAAQHRNDDALALLDEADAIARADQAYRILQQVGEARTELAD